MLPSNPTMNETTARKLLGARIQPNGSLKETEDNWIVWPVRPDGEVICVDGYFTAEQLEALVWWMRNNAVPQIPTPPRTWHDSLWKADENSPRS